MSTRRDDKPWKQPYYQCRNNCEASVKIQNNYPVYATRDSCLNVCGMYPDVYYDCVSGNCVPVNYPTAFVNQPTCSGMCKPYNKSPYKLLFFILLIVVILWLVLIKKKI